MKKSILLAAFVLISIACFSQDLISLKRGARVEAIITEITPTLVRYKLFSDPNGRTYFIYKDDVSGIMYKDGRVETFGTAGSRTVERESRPAEDRSQRSNSGIGNRENFETKSQPAYNRNQTNDIIIPDGRSEYVVYLKSGSIIRGTIIEQIPNKSIKIETGDGNIFAYQMDDIDRIVKGTNFQGRYNRTTRNSSGFYSGYRGIIDIGYYFGIGNAKLDRINLNIINGYQVNQYFSLGVGIGAHYYMDADAVLVPFFADFRANFINGPVSPYFSFDVGYSFDTSDNFHGMGLLINPTIGVSIKTSIRNEIHAGIGYQLQGTQGYYSDYYPYYSSHINLNAIALKVGFSF